MKQVNKCLCDKDIVVYFKFFLLFLIFYYFRKIKSECRNSRKISILNEEKFRYDIFIHLNKIFNEKVK